MTIKKCLIFSAALLLVSGFTETVLGDNKPASTIDDLLARVIAHQKNVIQSDDKRLAEFKREQSRQQATLNAARQAVASLEQIGKDYKNTIDDNSGQLTLLNEEIDKTLSNYKELFGVTRQVAAEVRSSVQQSMVSAQFKHRTELLDAIAEGDRLPTLQQLKALWLLLLQEQTEQGKVSAFSTQIANREGLSIPAEVLRLGGFTAVADGQYLSFNQETEMLEVLQRQPEAVHRRLAENVANATPGEIVAATIDPSGGTILGLLVQTPNLLERFHQGGIVGYIVTAMAIAGISLGLLRIIILSWTSHRVTRQIKNRQPDMANPLGRILQVYEKNPNADTETLELKLHDAIMQEAPKLDKGLNTLKVLAAVAPLMGLLGTVVGMIITFQAITLWGAGDPKLMAGGISQALMTTVQGLIAAIPLLLLHSIASGKVKNLQQTLQEQSTGLIAKRAEVLHG